MLALGPGVGYVHEPFNRLSAPLIGPLVDGFTYVHAGNQDPFLASLEEVLGFRWNRRFSDARDARDLGRVVSGRATSAWHRVTGARPLVKDPMAVLSAEWLATTFDMDVVVTVRHPGAFAASLLRLGWRYDFTSLLGQDELMGGLLASFADDLEAQLRKPDDIIGEVGLLWRILHHVILGYRDRHPEWEVVRHEDLAGDPVEGFARLFEHVDLPLTTRTEARIRAASAGTNPAVPDRDPVHGVRRDSRTTIGRWRQEITDADTARLRELTEPVAGVFYADEEW